MSRIGRMPIAVPAGVTVEIAENNKVTVKGPKGTLERVLPAEMEIKKDGEEIVVSRPNDLKRMKSLHGLTRTLINNMIIGVTQGYEKALEINTGGFSSACRQVNPHPEILKRYYELGGRIVTFGSDAHAPKDIARQFAQAGEILRNCGFREYCSFQNRSPVFHKL